MVDAVREGDRAVDAAGFEGGEDLGGVVFAGSERSDGARGADLCYCYLSFAHEEYQWCQQGEEHHCGVVHLFTSRSGGSWGKHVAWRRAKVSRVLKFLRCFV